MSNGNYVVGSSNSGALGMLVLLRGALAPQASSATVSSSNSLVGSTTMTGWAINVTALSNGNYVVRSTLWDGAPANAGALTWEAALPD